MKTWTLPLILLLSGVFMSSPVSAKGKQKQDVPKPDTTPAAGGVEVSETSGVASEAAVVDSDTPAALATGANALPEPPSMQELLTQGGGPESKASLHGSADGGSSTRSSLGGSSLALGFGLFLMGAGLGAGVVMTRRKSGVSGSLQTPRLKHVKSIRLSPKHQISLIETQGRQLVVGITSAQMTLLATLDDDADQDTALTEALFSGPTEKPAHETADKKTVPAGSGWDELFSSAIKQRQQKLHSQVPENKAVPKSKPVEPEVSSVIIDLPPALTTSAPVSEQAPPEQEQQEDGLNTANAVVHETEDYTLEEEDTAQSAEPVPQESPVELDEVARHDGMFAAHDAVHHPQVAPRKVRRSRESDSMLIALAAMREEVSR